MEKASSESVIVPLEIWDEVLSVLDSVSDEVDEEYLGEGFLLKYEGWSSICFLDILDKPGKSRRELSEEEIELICFRYAEEESYRIIEQEWTPLLTERGYHFIDGGYEPGGLYGRTWALFKKDRLV